MSGLINDEVRHSTFIRAVPHAVYAAIANGAGWDAWFTSGTQLDARPGGKIHLKWRDWGPDHVTAEDDGTVLQAQPAERFVFEWHPDNPGYSTTVEIAFEAVPGGTVLRLREWGYHDTPSGLRAMLDCATGWGEALTLLKFYLEHEIVY